MAQVATNADTYAAKRQNVFFKTVYPALEGQCVTLTKCFMQDMTDVPNPHAARGDARYVGKRLVAEGHATEVAYSKRKRGDIICYEFGQYGHIATQLSGGRVFEQNVKWPGVASKTVYGSVVYASRIGSETEAWRADKNPHVYRLKTYNEGEDMPNLTPHFASRLVKGMWGKDITKEQLAVYTKVEEGKMMRRIVDDPQTDKEFARVAALEGDVKPLPQVPPGKYIQT